MTAAKEKVSPLLELLDQRWNEVIRDIPDPTADEPAHRPVFAPDFQRQLRTIAQSHGEANNSDPFAAGRAMHYMRQGYYLPSEVRDDARKATSQRRAQGVTFPSVKLTEIAA